MTYGGAALGHYEGQVVLVNGGLPGETVRVRIDEERRRFMRATVVEVIDPSPDRVVPRCPHFGLNGAACGGCHWQHIAYAAQLRYKAAIVREQLQRLGGVRDPIVSATLPSPAIWAYRNHAQFHRASDGRPGFQAARSRNVVPLQECHIIEPPLPIGLGCPIVLRRRPRL